MSQEFNLFRHFEANSSHKLADRREAVRFEYRDHLFVVPCPNVPTGLLGDLLAQMVRAKGHDISQKGASFYLPFEPKDKQYLIQLGEIPKAILLLAEVMRVQEGFWDRTRQFRVACRFTQRIPF